MISKKRLPSPALVLAGVALFVATTGTAAAVTAAAVPLAKRALLADNAKKLEGKSASALVQQASSAAITQAASAPGPASTAAGLVTVKSAPWSLAPGQGSDFGVSCDAGQKAIGGGYDNPNGDALGLDTRPGSDGASWRVFLGNLSSSAGASGNVYATCLK